MASVQPNESRRSEGSVTQWLRLARTGDDQAITELYNRMLMDLMEVAKEKMGDHPRRMIDEEDIVVIVLAKLFRKLSRGHFDGIRDRNELWALVIRMTQQKVEHEIDSTLTRARRHGLEQSATGDAPDPSDHIDRLESATPNAEHLAILADQLSKMLEILPDEGCRKVARLKLEGYNSREICFKLNSVPHNITRKLKRIQAIWSRRLEEEQYRDGDGPVIIFPKDKPR